MDPARLDIRRATLADVADVVALLVREDAPRFYRRLGFEHTHAGMKLDL